MSTAGTQTCACGQGEGPAITPLPPVQRGSDGNSTPAVDLTIKSRLAAVDGWILPVRLNGVAAGALIDSGAGISVMSKTFYHAMPQSVRKPLRPYGKVITCVGDSYMLPLGLTEVEVEISDKVYRIEMVVSSGKETASCYLGMDFFMAHGCDFSVLKGLFFVGDKAIPMKKESLQDTCARIRVEEDIVIPPRSEVTVTCQAEGKAKAIPTQFATVEPWDGYGRMARDSLFVGATLTDPAALRCFIPIMNTSDMDRCVRRGTTVGVMYPATGVTAVNEESPADMTSTDRGSRGCEPVELPAYLKPLMDGLSEDLSAVQRNQLAATLYEYRDVFSEGPHDMGRTNLVTHCIDTQDSRPIRQPPRRLPIAKQEIERAEVEKMLEKEVIEPSSSSWSSPVVLVTKKDGSTRFCVDYRRVNKVTRKDAYPLPRIDDTLDALSGSMFFSTLDLYSGYWQVEMDPADKEKTAFATKQGLFQWKVMPFGLCNAPATFERLMELVLTGLNWKICLIYLDDIIVFGRNFDDALANLRCVWDRLRQANLKLKPSKCVLFRAEVPFLGHVVTRTGVEVDPAKTEAVDKWPEPETVKDVRSFLGLASYYRRFIPNFATIASPLVALTRKECPRKVVWTLECTEAFDRLKKALASPPLLGYPLREGHFYVSTDASDCGTGAVLEQDQVVDGRVIRKVIAYASKTLTRSQRRYCATNRELLAVVTACDQFRYYLLGRSFTIITDHASLVWLQNFKEPEGMVARWIQRLSVFDYTTIHRAGKLHGNADGLSRQKSRPCKRSNCPECLPLRKDSSKAGKPVKVRNFAPEMLKKHDSLFKDSGFMSDEDDLIEDSSLFDTELEERLALPLHDGMDGVQLSGRSELPVYPHGCSTGEALRVRRARVCVRAANMWQELSESDIRAAQEKDEDLAFLSKLVKSSTVRPSWSAVARHTAEVKCLWSQWDKLEFRNGILYRRAKDIKGWQPALQFVTPRQLRRTFFRKLHHGPLAGHQGVSRTLANLKARYYWPLMKNDVAEWCQQCHTCGRNKPLPKHSAPLKQSVTGCFNEKVCVDLMGPFAKTERKNVYIMVIQDHFTKWMEAVALPNKEGLTVADAIATCWFTVHGAPTQLHSDNGGEFISAVTRELCTRFRVDKTWTTSHRPQSNGLVERGNRSLQAILRSYVNEHRNDWDDYLPAALCAYRTTPHASTGLSPFKMVYGREMTIPLDLQIPTGESKSIYSCETEYVQWLQDTLHQAHAKARVHLGKAAVRQKKGYRETTREFQFKRGDWVWRTYPKYKPGKLLDRNTGPWLVLARLGDVNYRIQLKEDAPVYAVHVDKLTRYVPEVGVTLVPWISMEDTATKSVGLQTCFPGGTTAVASPVSSPSKGPAGVDTDGGPVVGSTPSKAGLPAGSLPTAVVTGPTTACITGRKRSRGRPPKEPVVKSSAPAAPTGRDKPKKAPRALQIPPGKRQRYPLRSSTRLSGESPAPNRASSTTTAGLATPRPQATRLRHPPLAASTPAGPALRPRTRPQTARQPPDRYSP